MERDDVVADAGRSTSTRGTGRPRGRPRKDGSTKPGQRAQVVGVNTNGTGEPLKRKRGRPSKEEVARRQAISAEQAQIAQSASVENQGTDPVLSDVAAGSTSANHAMGHNDGEHGTRSPHTDGLELPKHGLILDGDRTRASRADEAHLLDGEEALSLAQSIERLIASGAASFALLRPDERDKYRCGRQSAVSSFLNPPPSTAEAEDDDVEMVAAIRFEEALPSIGHSIDVIMGPEEHEEQISIRMHASIALADATKDSDKAGCLLNVGSHVYSTDWSPKGRARAQADDAEFLCVSAALDLWPRTSATERIEAGSRSGALQIWSVTPEDWNAKLEMMLCFDGGRMACVRWIPLLRTFGDVEAWIGLLTVAMHDGTVGIYVVPHPDAIERPQSDGEGVPCLRLNPLVQLDTRRGAPLCMEWLNVDKLAVGYTDGFLAVWSLSRALRLAERGVARPLLYTRVSRSALSDVAWDTNGSHVYSASYDGSLYATTLAQPDYSTTLLHSRDTTNTVAFQRDLGAPMSERLDDNAVRLTEYTNAKIGSRLVYPHYGRIRSMTTSAHHPFVASASSDGTVRAANVPLLLHFGRRWAGAGSSTVFRLDMLDRSKGTLRFLDNIEPLPIARSAPYEPVMPTLPVKMGLTMAWHPAIGVTSVRWNENFGRETWLASGMAAGMVRIDVVGKAASVLDDSGQGEAEETDGEMVN